MKQVLARYALLLPLSIPALCFSTSGLSTPVATARGMKFSCTAPQAEAVYLAGSFNNWAHNEGGQISDDAAAMRREDDALWVGLLQLQPGRHSYKFVIKDSEGIFHWQADPNNPLRDKQGNSILTGEMIAGPIDYTSAQRSGPKFPETIKPDKHPPALEGPLSLDRVWIRPGESTAATVMGGTHRIDWTVKTAPEQRVLMEKSSTTTVKIGPFEHEGAYLVTAVQDGKEIGSRVLTVAQNIGDDLRYGFFARWGELGLDYDQKAELLASLHVNAVEFYDYFPGHGEYAPSTETYTFEPFGIPILGVDVQRKQEALTQRNILPVAYVAAYSASEKIRKEHPFPMLDARGEERVYNKWVMPLSEAISQDKEPWFYLMAIQRGSPWHTYIMREFDHVVRKGDGDLASFHGICIDTLGHADDDRYFDQNTPEEGRLLTDVLAEFVADTCQVVHDIHPHGLVGFNSVNELGITNLYTLTDFLFMENWAVHKSSLEDIVDLCFDHRAPSGQRVVLKLYPADMTPALANWNELELRMVLGACMTGGGSLMVAGEPDEASGRVRAISHLYHPNALFFDPETLSALRRYYFHDALQYRNSHGRNVHNMDRSPNLPGCLTRAYLSDEGLFTVNILHREHNYEWNRSKKAPVLIDNFSVSIPLPTGRIPKAVYFSSPDHLNWLQPRPLNFTWSEGAIHCLLPQLDVYATLQIQTSSNNAPSEDSKQD